MSEKHTNHDAGVEMEGGPSRRGLLRALGTATTAGLLGTSTITTNTGATSADPEGCPDAEPLASPRPGPSTLYDDLATAPQFEPTDGWSADAILVCGQTAYDDGEFLSQGWPFDDRGPNGEREYPDDTERYANNAADILEIRARSTDRGVAYRIALNTMIEPDAAVVAIGIDTGDGNRTDWGHGLGDLGAGVDHVLVTWGEGATFDGEALADEDFSVDVERNHLEVEVALDPDRETWHHYAVSGVHDGDGGFAEVGTLDLSDEPPVFNVGFRTEDDEPLSSWRDETQADALSDRDISELGTDIDFGRLRDGDTDRSVPQQGYVNRVYVSRYDLGPGIDEGDPRTVFQSRVQPYSVYIPESYEPGESSALHVLLHSLTENYNQYADTPNMLQQLGEQRDAIILMPHGRGPEGWWKNEAELDAFEAWADLAARYDIDFDRVTLGGYSMGGHGTYRLGSLYPDLFARGFAVVGPADEAVLGAPTNGEVGGDISRYSENPQNMMRVTDNLRHVPLLMWAGVIDELVPYPGVRNYRDRLADHGYRHRLDSFPSYDHFRPAVVDEWGPGREFLGDATVEREPARVIYRAIPEFGTERFGLVHDGAYWIHDIEVANDADDGVIDAISLISGYSAPATEEFEEESMEPEPNTREGTRWEAPLEGDSEENAIELDCNGITAATLYVDEVDVDTTQPLELRVESTHETALTLQSGAGGETLIFPAGESTESVVLCERGPTR